MHGEWQATALSPRTLQAEQKKKCAYVDAEIACVLYYVNCSLVLFRGFTLWATLYNQAAGQHCGPTDSNAIAIVMRKAISVQPDLDTAIAAVLEVINPDADTIVLCILFQSCTSQRASTRFVRTHCTQL